MRIGNSDIPFITHSDKRPINNHRKYRVCAIKVATFLLLQYNVVCVYTVIPRLTNMDSANECFSGCAPYHKAVNVNGRDIPGDKFNQLWTDFSLLLQQRDRGHLLNKRRLTLNKLWKFVRRIVKTLCTYFQTNSIKCIIYFQYNSVKMVSFSFYCNFHSPSSNWVAVHLSLWWVFALL